MNKIIRRINRIIKIILPLSFLFISACNETNTKGSGVTKVESNQPSNKILYSDSEHSVTLMTDDKKYITTLYSQLYPLRVGKVHSWILEIKSADNSPLEITKVYVHGGMPVHQHGFPTRPRVTQLLGNGKYLVEGVKFSMPGEWEMRFNIKEKTKRDRVVYKIKI